MDLPNGGSLLATGSDDQTIKLWQVPSGGLTRSLTESDAQYELKGHYGGVRALEFHPTAPVMASAAASTEIAFWDLEKGTKLAGGGFSHGLGSGSSGGGKQTIIALVLCLASSPPSTSRMNHNSTVRESLSKSPCTHPIIDLIVVFVVPCI
jgi:WD40 repeat protein